MNVMHAQFNRCPRTLDKQKQYETFVEMDQSFTIPNASIALWRG